MVEIERTNTILYCRGWDVVVAFYRDRLCLPVAFGNDWFVEFRLTSDSYLSVADAARTSIAPGDGAGITLSWRVPDAASVRRTLTYDGVDVGELVTRWNALVVYLHDPAGNRIELWSPLPDADG